MRIAVFGTGGVGGYFGGRLAQAGEEVFFIARGAHLQAIRSNGLEVKSIEGDFSIEPARATSDPAEIGPVDVVLVGVKAWQLPEAAEAMKPLISRDTVVVPLENGVESVDVLARVLGTEHVLGGLCKIAAMIDAPGVIRHVGLSPFVQFGEVGNDRSDRVESLRSAFEHAEGVTVDVPADIDGAVWQKFVFIASWSGVGAVAGTPLGPILDTAESHALLRDALTEAVAVGRGKGVRLPADIVETTMAFFASLDPTVTASMQRDVTAGKPFELEAQTGAIVRLGRRYSVPTPVNQVLYRALKPAERIAFEGK